MLRFVLAGDRVYMYIHDKSMYVYIKEIEMKKRYTQHSSSWHKVQAFLLVLNS